MHWQNIRPTRHGRFKHVLPHSLRWEVDGNCPSWGITAHSHLPELHSYQALWFVFCKLLHPVQNNFVAMESCSSPRKSEFEHLDDTLNHSLVLGGPETSRALYWMILIGPFQLETFYGSVILMWTNVHKARISQLLILLSASNKARSRHTTVQKDFLVDIEIPAGLDKVK